jgi:hypothetical protein
MGWWSDYAWIFYIQMGGNYGGEKNRYLRRLRSCVDTPLPKGKRIL